MSREESQGRPCACNMYILPANLAFSSICLEALDLISGFRNLVRSWHTFWMASCDLQKTLHYIMYLKQQTKTFVTKK